MMPRRKRREEEEGSAKQKVVHSMTAYMADSTRIPIIKTLVESCVNLAFPETPCHALCHACCMSCVSMTQLISSHPSKPSLHFSPSVR